MAVLLIIAVVVLWVGLLAVVALCAAIRSRLSIARAQRRGGSAWRATSRGNLVTATALTIGLCAALYAAGLAAAWKDGRDLRQQIAGASRLVVRSGGMCHRRLEEEIVLLETTDRAQMEAFAGLWNFGVGVWGAQCKCCGEMTFELYDGATLTLAFSLHHAQNVRIGGSARGDRMLSGETREALARWLDETGIAGRLEVAATQRVAEREAEPERTEAAMTAPAN